MQSKLSVLRLNMEERVRLDISCTFSPLDMDPAEHLEELCVAQPEAPIADVPTNSILSSKTNLDCRVQIPFVAAATPFAMELRTRSMRVAQLQQIEAAVYVPFNAQDGVNMRACEALGAMSEWRTQATAPQNDNPQSQTKRRRDVQAQTARNPQNLRSKAGAMLLGAQTRMLP